MFRSLADKLAGVFDKLKGRGVLTEEVVNDSMREIKIALLEADVALPVVKTFIASVKEKAVGLRDRPYALIQDLCRWNCRRG